MITTKDVEKFVIRAEEVERLEAEMKRKQRDLDDSRKVLEKFDEKLRNELGENETQDFIIYDKIVKITKKEIMIMKPTGIVQGVAVES